MEQLSNKVNRGSGANYQLTAEQWNQVPQELENLMASFSIALSDADLNQVGKAIASYVGSGDFFVDSGVANSVVLSPLGTQRAPTSYTNGQRVRFRAAATNTGATVINVDSIGSKKLRNQSDSALAAGNIVAGTQYELTYNTSFDSGAGAFVLNVPSSITNTMPLGYLSGAELSVNATDAVNDIDISAGAAKSSDNALDMVLGAALGKRIDAAWTAGGTVGATLGGFPTGITLTNNTWYRVFLIGKVDGTVDAGFDTSAGAANLLADATGYTKYRQIGWVRRGVGTNIKFFQNGDLFVYDIPSNDFSAIATLTAQTHTLLAPPNTLARYAAGATWGTSANSAVYALFTRTDQTDSAPTSTLFNFVTRTDTGIVWADGQSMETQVDASSQIRSRFSVVSGSTLTIQTTGWIDRRGK